MREVTNPIIAIAAVLVRIVPLAFITACRPVLPAVALTIAISTSFPRSTRSRFRRRRR